MTGEKDDESDKNMADNLNARFTGRYHNRGGNIASQK